MLISFAVLRFVQFLKFHFRHDICNYWPEIYFTIRSLMKADIVNTEMQLFSSDRVAASHHPKNYGSQFTH